MPDQDPIGDDLLGRLRAHADVGLEPAAQARAEARLDDHLATVQRRAGRGRLAAWLASHSAIALGVLAVAGAGGTAAAVVGFTGRPSAPAEGLIPRAPGEHRKRDLTYGVSMSPGLQVGEVTWCTSTRLRYVGERRWSGGTGCGLVPRSGSPSLGGSTTYLGPGRGLIATWIVTGRVAYGVTTEGERVAPVDDPALPNGWRVLVLLPGETHDGKLRFRDADGRPVWSRWRGRPREHQPFTGSGGAVPDGAPCGIGAPADASVRGSRWLTAPAPEPSLEGRALLPCAQTSLRLGDEWGELVVLLDAAAPGRAEPMALPASSSVAGRRDVVELPAGASYYQPPPGEPRRSQRWGPAVLRAGDTAAARRIDRGWLIARAPTRALRLALLDGATARTPQP